MRAWILAAALCALVGCNASPATRETYDAVGDELVALADFGANLAEFEIKDPAVAQDVAKAADVVSEAGRLLQAYAAGDPVEIETLRDALVAARDTINAALTAYGDRLDDGVRIGALFTSYALTRAILRLEDEQAPVSQ